MDNFFFTIKNLSLWINKDKIIKNFSLNAKKGDIIAIVGPNGSGKSTLLKGIFNHFSITKKTGGVFLNKEEITNSNPCALSHKGLFLAFQNPVELEGIKNIDFLKLLVKENSSFKSTYEKITGSLDELSINHDLLTRDVNVGFSGGQKKKNEILQSLLLEPKILLLDEIDSGLDTDGIKAIANLIKKTAMNKIFLVVSHRLDFFKFINPKKVIVLSKGIVVKVGNNVLLKKYLEHGFGESKFENKDPFLVCKTKI